MINLTSLVMSEVDYIFEWNIYVKFFLQAI